MEYDKGVSVIVPIYNAEDYLKKCLNSIVKQTMKDLEIICVLDAKTDDDSERILKNLAKSDKRIKIINDITGKGQGYNRNLGIEEATKEYIGFVDSDDYLDVDFYEKLYDFAKVFNTDVSQGEIILIDSVTNQIFDKRKYALDCMYNLVKIFSTIQEGVCWDKIYRTSFIKDNKNIRFPVEVFHEDNYFILQVMSKCNKLLTVPGTYYYWNRNQFSICFNPAYKEKRIEDANTVLNLILDDLSKMKTTKVENDMIIRFMLDKFGGQVIKDERYRESLIKRFEKLTR